MPPLTLVHSSPTSLDTLLVRHPHTTHLVQVGAHRDTVICESTYLGVRTGDILTVDRSMPPTVGCLVLAVCEGQLMLCRYTEHEGKSFLVCGAKDKTPFEISPHTTKDIWGVVSTLSRHL